MLLATPGSFVCGDLFRFSQSSMHPTCVLTMLCVYKVGTTLYANNTVSRAALRSYT